MGSPTSAPQFLSELSPVEAASECQILGFYCYFLKKKNKKKQQTQFFFKRFPCSNLHLEKQLKLFFGLVRKYFQAME